MLPIIGYIGVANIEGANFEDASTYNVNTRKLGN